MEIGAALISAIGTLGFPIVCCLLMGWFIYKVFQKTTDESAQNMAAMQARCKEREDKLYAELAESRAINAQAMAVLAQYAEKLDIIQTDINEIKEDIILLTAQ